MSGLTAFLQTELLTLSSEARRKHPEIKEAAERLSAILRSFKERPGHSIANELSKSEDALRPFVLACETKQVKLVTIAIGCIQKLISFHAIPETSVRTILRKLTDISVHGVEIQLKILQTVLPLLTNYRSVHDDILAEALLICFRLQDSKIVVVNNTAAATLRQLVIFVFDKVVKEDTEDPAEDEPKHEIKNGDETLTLRPCAKDAYYLFQDLCLLTNGEPPEFLRLTHLSKTFGLELIESVLTNHYGLFRAHNELSGLLRERVCPLIIKHFSEKHEFPQTMRLTRVVYILIKQFSEILVMECEIFLSMFVKILEPESPHWQRVLAMEIFRGVCSDSTLLCSIYKWYDLQGSSTDVFRDMITAFGRLATEKPQLIGATQGGRESLDFGPGSSTHALHHTNVSTSTPAENGGPILSAAGSIMRIQCIDQLDKAEPPAIPETYIFYLAAVCLNCIADNLAGLVLPKFSAGSGKSLIVNTGSAETNETDENADTTEPKQKDDLALVTDMANVAWPGLLAAMSFYLSANLDEELFQSTMRSYQNFTNVCGVLNLVTPRDAFLTNLCKNSIPTNPVLSSGLLSSKSTSSTTSIATTATSTLAAVSFHDLPVQQQQLLANITLSDKNLYSLRVLLNIAMYLGGVLGPSWYLVLETLQQADFLLFNRLSPKGSASATTGSVSNAQGVRRTLPGTVSSAPSTPPIPSASQPSTSQLMDTDHIAIIQGSLNRLFENSKYLDDDPFIAFTTALCRLSAEASGSPFQEDVSVPNKSSRAKIFNNTSFAVEKLRYISTLNMERLIRSQPDTGAWDLITIHLIATANYPQTPGTIRSQCCDTIADIIISAMDYGLDKNNDTGENLQMRLLTALNQCINYTPRDDHDKSTMTQTFPEVQKMGLETLNKILQTSGHSFTCGWGLIFDMVKHVTQQSTAHHMQDMTEESDEPQPSAEDDSSSYKAERTSIDTTTSSLRTVTTATHASKNTSAGLIKVAFASLQLICTDFLSLLSPDCLRQCTATLGAFGLQSEDLNISLTAVGLLWNLSDFIQTKRQELAKLESSTGDVKIDTSSLNIDTPLDGDESIETLSTLWMLLLLQLSHICTDWRPEVRNGANQTLFRTIMINGGVLGPELWRAVTWQVLFPLLDSIKMSAIRAVKMMERSPLLTPSADRDAAGFMLHHSRDTADKQWDETKVLVLTGISNLFRDFLGNLHTLPRFEQAWSLLLAHLEDSCLRSSQEVSLASIRSFKSIVSQPLEDDTAILPLWRTAWSAWLIIGEGVTVKSGEPEDVAAERDQQDAHQRSRKLDSELHPLTLSLSTSSVAPIAEDFSQDTLTAYVHTFADLYRVIGPTFSLQDVSQLLGVLRNILVYGSSPQYRPDVDHLSPLQEATLDVIQELDMQNPGVPPLVLRDLAEYMTLAFLSPTVQDDRKPPSQRRFSSVTYIAINKRCSQLVADLFKKHHANLALYSEGVFERILGAYGLPMKLKYDCPPSHKHGDDKTPLWKLATTHLLEVLRLGLEVLHNFGEEVTTERFVGVWRTLIDIFEGSLLSPSTPPSSLSIEELDVDEHFDIFVLSVIQSDIVIYLGQPRVPENLISKLIHVIRLSSRLYYIDESDEHRHKESEEEQATRALAIEDMGRSSDIVGTTGTIVPVMKESFAYAAFKTLFALCSAEKQDHAEVRKRIAQSALPILLERCEMILRNYTADEPLLGRCPFPRYLMGVRKDEMFFFLRQSIDLRLQEGIMPVQDETSVKQLLLSGPRAHLFYLYPALCKMITCDDPHIVRLIRDCLEAAGAEVGLFAPPPSS